MVPKIVFLGLLLVISFGVNAMEEESMKAIETKAFRNGLKFQICPAGYYVCGEHCILIEKVEIVSGDMQYQGKKCSAQPSSSKESGVISVTEEQFDFYKKYGPVPTEVTMDVPTNKFKCWIGTEDAINEYEPVAAFKLTESLNKITSPEKEKFFEFKSGGSRLELGKKVKVKPSPEEYGNHFHFRIKCEQGVGKPLPQSPLLQNKDAYKANTKIDDKSGDDKKGDSKKGDQKKADDKKANDKKADEKKENNKDSTSKKKDDGLRKKMGIGFVIVLLVGTSVFLIWYFAIKEDTENDEYTNYEEEGTAQHTIKKNDAVIDVQNLKIQIQ